MAVKPETKTAAKKAPSKKPAKAAGTKAASTGVKKPNALTTEVPVSDALAAIVGKGPMARSQVTSKLWEYIKSNKLQSKADGRQIEPDAKLAAVIGKDTVSMFAMTGLVSKHIG